MYATFISRIWDMIGSLVDLLKDPQIANYMFGGVSLFEILITFLCAFIIIRFYINSFRVGSLPKDRD